MSAKLSLAAEANLDELQRFQEAVVEFGEAQDWPSDLAYQVELVIEEMCVNIINYGYDGESLCRMELAVDSQADALIIEISDNGRAFDPLQEAPSPDLSLDVEERPIGGLGVYLVKSIMDEAHYRRKADKNYLKLVKRRNP